MFCFCVRGGGGVQYRTDRESRERRRHTPLLVTMKMMRKCYSVSRPRSWIVEKNHSVGLSTIMGVQYVHTCIG